MRLVEQVPPSPSGSARRRLATKPNAFFAFRDTPTADVVSEPVRLWASEGLDLGSQCNIGHDAHVACFPENSPLAALGGVTHNPLSSVAFGSVVTKSSGSSLG